MGCLNWVPRTATATIALGLSLSLSGAADAQQRTRVTAAVTETIASVNPYADSVALMYAIYSQTYGSIVDWSFEKGGYVSRFAESWSNPDKLTWVFKLKKGMKRNNGEPVLAADFIHSVNRAKNDPQSKQRHNVRWISEMSAPDDHTVIFKTSEPVAPMLEHFSRVAVTSKAQYDKHGPAADKDAPFGAGPYAIKQIAVDNFFAMTKVPDHPDVKPEQPGRDHLPHHEGAGGARDGAAQRRDPDHPDGAAPPRPARAVFRQRPRRLGGLGRDHVHRDEPAAEALG